MRENSLTRGSKSATHFHAFGRKRITLLLRSLPHKNGWYFPGSPKKWAALLAYLSRGMGRGLQRFGRNYVPHPSVDEIWYSTDCSTRPTHSSTTMTNDWTSLRNEKTSLTSKSSFVPFAEEQRSSKSRRLPFASSNQMRDTLRSCCPVVLLWNSISPPSSCSYLVT